MSPPVCVPPCPALPCPARRKRGFEEWGPDGDRPFVLSRAFFAGTQRIGAIWTGDNEGACLCVPVLARVCWRGCACVGVRGCAGPYCLLPRLPTGLLLA